MAPRARRLNRRGYRPGTAAHLRHGLARGGRAVCPPPRRLRLRLRLRRLRPARSLPLQRLRLHLRPAGDRHRRRAGLLQHRHCLPLRQHSRRLACVLGRRARNALGTATQYTSTTADAPPAGQMDTHMRAGRAGASSGASGGVGLGRPEAGAGRQTRGGSSSSSSTHWPAAAPSCGASPPRARCAAPPRAAAPQPTPPPPAPPLAAAASPPPPPPPPACAPPEPAPRTQGAQPGMSMLASRGLAQPRAGACTTACIVAVIG
jgi:hypothetical protein